MSSEVKKRNSGRAARKEKSMRVLFNRKRIDVKEVKEYEVKWGYHYTLYTDGNAYYITESDGSNEVIFFGNYENEELAIADFNKYMVEFEKENME